MQVLQGSRAEGSAGNEGKARARALLVAGSWGNEGNEGSEGSEGRVQTEGELDHMAAAGHSAAAEGSEANA